MRVEKIIRPLCCILLGTFLNTTPISAEIDLDYNYEYEKNGLYTKFSDWVPYKLHKWEPKFLEDYYQLYGLKLHYGENELRRNIYFLKIGLKKRFRHPKNALCPVKDEEEYYKYRNLLFMHINLQIMRSYMRIASQFDKRHLYFYNLDFAYDLNRSFEVADGFYKEAIPYWKEAQRYADRSSEIDSDLDLGTMETERYEIMTGKLDFGKIIEDHLARLGKKRNTVQEFLAKHPDANKPLLE
ncbi:hypothetical protein [Leptospira santarosai]|uniref:Signal peptide protein n=1 Tax=Leptospira santarosai serovar Shermani str. LT 821 TaxID=758847 RepID=K8Y4A7_9LEPT|nr:hypothetical protein [Leptospira santarosai]EKT88438.1 signal peptide protein [Leptospira santarosai serovar Shermani str. LT 821]EMO83732.1 hypothetical protein LEP1GSC070_0679 [Leptospira santarosai str. AIM]EPG84200.1 hypothetical protein LEP1GSC048_0868 [Leptospira santarosai serovar Shermani str. 1342KT]